MRRFDIGMREIPSSIYALHRRFNAFEEFAEEIVAWGTDFRQLSADARGTELTQIGSSSLQLSLLRLGCHCEQQGESPKGFRTFGLPTNASSPFTWRRQKVPPNSVLVFGSDDEFESTSRPGFEVLTLAIAESELETVLVGSELLEYSSDNGAVLECVPESLQRLHQRIEALLQISRLGAAVPMGRLLDLAGEDLPLFLWEAISGGKTKMKRLAGASRRNALAKAREWVRVHQTQPVSVHDLSQAVGVSERTLHRAFVEYYGVGPSEYMRAIRLSEVHRELRLADPRTTKIKDIAVKFGFWHASQFATDYRHLFGELPSETLGRWR